MPIELNGETFDFADFIANNGFGHLATRPALGDAPAEPMFPNRIFRQFLAEADGTVTAAADSATAAAASEVAAAASAGEAAASAVAAADSAAGIADAQAAAEAARDKAQDWAGEAEGVEVEPGLYSARHWSAKSQEWAETAEDVEVETGQFSALHWAAKAAGAAAGVNMPVIQPGDAGKALVVAEDESGFAVGQAPGVVTVTGDATVEAGKEYRIVSALPVTITLPPAPVFGTTVRLMDGETITSSVHHTVARNGQTIMGLAEDLTLDTAGIDLQIWFNGSDWRLF